METLRARNFVYDRLHADSTLMALIGNRLYRSGEVPEGTAFPYLEYMPYVDSPSVTMSGDVYMSQVRMQIKVYGQNTASATLEAIMDRVRFLLDKAKGTTTNGTILSANYIGSPPQRPEINGTVTYVPLLSEYLLCVQQPVFA